MAELRERDAMICRSCGKEERASEGYPCADCGRFICTMCTMRGVIRCRDCAERAQGAAGAGNEGGAGAGETQGPASGAAPASGA